MPLFEINKKLLLMKIHYFVSIGGYAPFSPFMPLIARQRGYSAFIVGLIFMLQPIPGVFTRPIVGAITDKYKCRRTVYITSSILLFFMTSLMLIMPGMTSKEEIKNMDVITSPLFWLFFGTITLINTIGMAKGVLSDTVCMNLLGEDRHKYGKQRLWGSVGWSLLAIISGACVDWYSKGLDYKNYAPCFVIACILFFIDIFIVSKLEVVQNSSTKAVTSVVKKVFTEGKVLSFLLWVVFFGFFMSFIWNFVLWYLEELTNSNHPEIKPWIKTLQGLALIIQCIGGEVPSFFLSSRILKRVDHMHMFSIMFFTFTIIFALYTVIKDPIWALPVEVLNGMVFGLTYPAAISYADLVSPTGAEGMLQGVVGTALNGIGSPAGSISCGYLIEHLGINASLRILCVLAFITCITQVVVHYLINRFSKNEVVKDIYIKVETKDNTEERL